MTQQAKQYSDEHINAYIDGELDSDECTRLVYDEQHDELLAQRINESRLLKEKVQLAYGNITDYESVNKPAHSPTMGNNRLRYITAFAASVLLTVTVFFTYQADQQHKFDEAKNMMMNAPGIPSDQLVASAAGDQNIIIDLNNYQPDTFADTLDNLHKLAASNDHAIEVVVNGDAVRALDAGSDYAGRIAALARNFANLKVIGCAQSINENPVSLLAETLTTPSAPYQVALRTAENWRYIKLD